MNDSNAKLVRISTRLRFKNVPVLTWKELEQMEWIEDIPHILAQRGGEREIIRSNPNSNLPD